MQRLIFVATSKVFSHLTVARFVLREINSRPHDPAFRCGILLDKGNEESILDPYESITYDRSKNVITAALGGKYKL